MRKIFFLLVFTLLVASSLQAQKKSITLVIDPGHGGSDPGHVSANSNYLPEKTLNLKIAKYIGSYIEKYLQNIKVVYTRTGDTYPSLDSRVNTANSANADYFISIHCNGNERTSVRGTESHVHSMKLKESVGLARAIEKQFSQRAGRKSRGVKDKNDLQHSLQVLKYTNMTSVLVECGFMTNPKEAAFLNTSRGQELLASAIYRAFRGVVEKKYPSIKFRKTSSTASSASASDSNTSISYAIQIASSKKPLDPQKDAWLNKSKMNVERRELNTKSAYKYIYIVGHYTSRKQADKALSAIKKKGFRDAIVIKR